MDDENLLRYSKQILLPQVGIKGQELLNNTTILLIGIGGLGSVSSIYLAASGVGHLIIVDFDKVELSNLQRQIVHYTNDINNLKIKSAKDKLLKINPKIKITCVENIDDNIDKYVKQSDIVLDGTDNFLSRFMINQSCVKNKKTLISAAVIRFEGQIATFNGYQSDKPCYNCLYSQSTTSDEVCSNSGVLAPIVGVLGSLQATQAIKAILNIGKQLDNELLLVDCFNLSFRTLRLIKDKKCKTCS